MKSLHVVLAMTTIAGTMPLANGSLLGACEIGDMLGGGMGEV